MTRKIFLCTLIITLAIGCSVSNSYATTGAYCGIGTYTLCGYGDRHGDLYVNYLSSKLSANNNLPNRVTRDYYVENSYVYPQRIANFAQFADLFVYSGHGLRYNYDSSLNNMANLHTYASSDTDTWHTPLSNYKDAYNLSWSEWPSSFVGKWGIFYTCNWLANGGNTSVANTCYKSLFDSGLMRLAVGFGSRMYLDQREANLFGDTLRSSISPKSIKQAFFLAAKKYQPQLPASASTYNNSVVARVCGYYLAENDTFSSYLGSPTGYSSRPQDYKSWDDIIPCTGVLVE